jgi:hypothetical protein
MVPENVLLKMRLGLGSTGLALLLSGCGQATYSKPVTITQPHVPVEPASPVITAPVPSKLVAPENTIPPTIKTDPAPRPASLSDGQMKTFKESLGQLGGSDENEITAAVNKIESLATRSRRPVVRQLLANELNNPNYPPEIKQKITKIINSLDDRIIDPCPGCGMG